MFVLPETRPVRRLAALAVAAMLAAGCGSDEPTAPPDPPAANPFAARPAAASTSQAPSASMAANTSQPSATRVRQATGHSPLGGP